MPCLFSLWGLAMRWVRLGRIWAPAGLCALSALCLAQTGLDLAAGIHRIRAEVANTAELRTQGLMRRSGLPSNGGMLFVFERTGQHCMWMRNTLIPLSVAFLDEQGRIINVEEMQPQTEDSHCAAKPAKFALEMNAGWFKAKGMSSGSVVVGIDKAPAAR